jgi:hypothetical protein
MSYIDGFNAANLHLDATCGRGWEGVKGRCKRSKEKDELIQGVDRLTGMMTRQELKSPEGRRFNKRGFAAYIVAVAALGIGMHYATQGIEDRARQASGKLAGVDQFRARLQEGQKRQELRSALEQLEKSREGRSSIKHEQKLKDFFSNISDLAGSEKEVLDANRKIVNQLGKMSPSEVNKFFEKKRREYEKLMGEGD